MLRALWYLCKSLFIMSTSSTSDVKLSEASIEQLSTALRNAYIGERSLCAKHSGIDTGGIYENRVGICSYCASDKARDARAAVRNNRWRKGSRELGMSHW